MIVCVIPLQPRHKETENHCDGNGDIDGLFPTLRRPSNEDAENAAYPVAAFLSVFDCLDTCRLPRTERKVKDRIKSRYVKSLLARP